MTNINLDAHKLATYLAIALNQRERAAKKFFTDYGANSAIYKEVLSETTELNNAITELKTGQADLEQKKK